MSWSVRGIDEEAREPAFAPTRSDPRTTSDWRDAGTGMPDLGRLERELDHLSARLARTSAADGTPLRVGAALAMTRRGGTSQGGDPEEFMRDSAYERADRDGQRQDPARRPQRAAADIDGDDGRLKQVMSAIETIDKRLSQLADARQPAAAPASIRDDRPRRPGWPPVPEGMRRQGDELAQALDQIGRRQRDLDPELAPGPQTKAAQRPVLASDIERHFQALTDQILDLRSTAQREDPHVAAALRETEMADLRTALESDISAQIGPLRAGIAEMRTTLKRVEEDVASRAATTDPAAVLVEMDLLRRDIGRLSPDAYVAAIENGLSRIGEHLQAMPTGGHDQQAIERLLADVTAVRTTLESRPIQVQLPSVEKALVALAGRIDELAARQPGPAPSLDHIRQMFDDVRPGALDPALVEAQLQPFTEMASRLAHLAERMEAGVAAAAEPQVPRSDPVVGAHLETISARMSAWETQVAEGGLAQVPAAVVQLAGKFDDLAAQVATLAQPPADVVTRLDRMAGQLESAETRQVSFGSVEGALIEIRQLLDQRPAAGDVAAEAVRQAVADFVRLTKEEGPGEALRALTTELGELRHQTRDLESRTSDSLKAVQDALTSMAGLLQQHLGQQQAAVAKAKAPAARAPASVITEPATRAARETETATARRADFITAARKAAQAAQATQAKAPAPAPAPAVAAVREPAPAPVAAPAALGSTSPRGLSRIAAVLRGRGKAITAIAAALVLAGIATEMTLNALEGMRRTPTMLAARPAQPGVADIKPDAVAIADAQPQRKSSDKVPEVADTSAPRTMPPTLLATPPAEVAAAGAGLPDAGRKAATPAADMITTGSVAPAEPRLTAVPAAPAPIAWPMPADKVGSPALMSAAASGDAAAAFEVGLRYAEGQGVTGDQKKALDWYRRAAEAGFVPAQYRLASALEKGLGQPKDVVEAKKWYLTAAEKGNVRAMHNLGVLYANERDMGNALTWFQKAADFGLRDSQFNLGIIYALGSSVKQDLATAYKWFAVAADTGDTEAARKRDELVQYIDKAVLPVAKQTATAWAPQPQDKSANDELTQWSDQAAVSLAGESMTDRVKRIQTAMKTDGVYLGQITGQITPDVKAAVKQYQRKLGLKPTGEIDEALLNALKAKTAG